MSENYAIINTGGKQYRVRQGDTVDVEKLSGESGAAVDFNEVLLTSVDGSVTIGKPTIAGARVSGEIVSTFRAKKVISYKYMAKTRRQRIRGHRQSQTAVKINTIVTG